MREVMAAVSRGGGLIRLVQHAVVAVADAQAILERLDVDVGRQGLDGAGDDAVHQADDRRFAGEILQPLGVFLQRFGGRRVGVGRLVAVGIEPVERGIELHRQSDQQIDRHARSAADKAAVVNGSSGSATATRRRPSSTPSGRARVLRRKRAAMRPGITRFGGEVGGRGRRQTGQVGIGTGKVAFGHETELDQHLVETLAALRRDPAPALDRAPVAMAICDQQGRECLDNVRLERQVHQGRRGVLAAVSNSIVAERSTRA